MSIFPLTYSRLDRSLTYSRLDSSGFDAVAKSHPDTVIPIEQSPAWSEFERMLGRRPLGIWAYRDAAGDLVATASFIHVLRPFREAVIAVNGPVWFSERTPAVERALMEAVREQFRMAPAVNPLYVRMQVAAFQPPAAGPLEHGWYEREIVVDLMPAEAELFRGFGSNARNRIGRARRHEVVVRQVPRAKWREVFARDLFPIMQETAERGGFRSFDAAYYDTFLAALGGHLRLFVASRDGVPISWLITTEYRRYAVYYFAASTHEARSTFAPYLLLWEAFKALKAAGNTACGLTGIESENYPGLANVTAFKKNFCKKVVVVPTTYDVPISPSQYAFVSSLMRGRRLAASILRLPVRRAAALAARVRRSKQSA